MRWALLLSPHSCHRNACVAFHHPLHSKCYWCIAPNQVPRLQIHSWGSYVTSIATVLSAMLLSAGFSDSWFSLLKQNWRYYSRETYKFKIKKCHCFIIFIFLTWEIKADSLENKQQEEDHEHESLCPLQSIQSTLLPTKLE